MSLFNMEPAVLVLADGTVFKGYGFGASGKAIGEVVFNTSMSGYQEILSDPSYAYQLITFTYPHIGNVGANEIDMESSKFFAAGAIVREVSELASNFRSEQTFSEFMKQHDKVGISGIDTRALVLHIREKGAQMGIIASGESFSLDALKDEASSLQGMEGKDLVADVTTAESYTWTEGGFYDFDECIRPHESERMKVCALDFGIKHNILRQLVDVGFDVTVVPASTTADKIMSMSPDGVFLSNGPGDPAAVSYGIQTTQELLGKVPIFGICLGHQILGLSAGVNTFKLKFGHRGGNHPVEDTRDKSVEISVQNHGFASHEDSVPSGVDITHINLNDRTVEGLEISDAKAFSVQFHPESSPGPHDSRYHFERFRDLVRSTR